MKILTLSIASMFIGIALLFSAHAFQHGENSIEGMLENVDAVDAVAIANQWKWSHRKIKSYVTSREVIFEFPNGKVKEIPLPEDRMLVAIAPYINRTHK